MEEEDLVFKITSHFGTVENLLGCNCSFTLLTMVLYGRLLDLPLEWEWNIEIVVAFKLRIQLGLALSLPVANDCRFVSYIHRLFELIRDGLIVLLSNTKVLKISMLSIIVLSCRTSCHICLAKVSHVEARNS